MSLFGKKEAPAKISITQIFSNAWFLREIRQFEKERRSMFSSSVQFQIIPNDNPDEPLNFEQEMRQMLSRVELEEDAVKIAAEYVPKIIRSLMETQPYANQLPEDRLEKYNLLCDKYKLTKYSEACRSRIEDEERERRREENLRRIDQELQEFSRQRKRRF